MKNITHFAERSDENSQHIPIDLTATLSVPSG
jgi:hypothetical protein